MTKLQPLRGMKDLLPQEFKVHDHIISKAKDVGGLYGYSQMSTPILEFTNVFDRTLGESSDVVSKEMYHFLDKSNESVALRPEFTAGIMRSFISNGLQYSVPLKYFSTGPVFRYDRPGAGRYRQFHQINFEYIGASEPYSDAELIRLAVHILESLQILGSVTLEINSLGCDESRKEYSRKLVEYFTKYESSLSEDSKKRLIKNPLRILDSKNERDKEIVKGAPLISESYTDYARGYFDDVLRYLDMFGVEYKVNTKIVRGLDYYCHTAFEFIANESATSNDTILAGGRYDGLSKLMGGPDMPAIGFAAGIERIALMKEYSSASAMPVFVMPINEDNLDYSLIVTDKIRQAGIPAIMDAKSKISKRMQRAVAQNAEHVIFIGESEEATGHLKVKNLANGQESSYTIEEIINILLS